MYRYVSAAALAATVLVTHRVVFNEGELDTCNLAPGAFSVATSLVAVGPYHCSIHPSMVGTTVDHGP